LPIEATENSRQLLQLCLGEPAPLAIRHLDSQPVRGDDQDDDISEGGKGSESGGGLERSRFQVGAGRFDAALKLMMQRADLLFEIFLCGLGIADARCFVFVLANQRLANEFGAGLAPPGISGLGSGFLKSLQLILDLLHFALFDRSVGRVKDAVRCLLIDGVDFHAGPICVDGNDDKANRDRALIRRLKKMTRRDGVFSNFEIDVAGALPWIEKRRGVHGFRAVQNWFLIENQSAMDDLIVNNELHSLTNFFQRTKQLAHEPGSGESFLGEANRWKKK